MDETFEAQLKKGKKTAKEVESMIKLAREVQAAVKIKKLRPGKSSRSIDGLIADPDRA